MNRESRTPSGALLALLALPLLGATGCFRDVPIGSNGTPDGGYAPDSGYRAWDVVARDQVPNDPPVDPGNCGRFSRDAGVVDAAQPVLGPVNTATVAPPPVSGGTLIVSRDGRTAIAADPDRDSVWLVDLDTAAVRQHVALTRGDEPGRVAEDSAGRVHVVLRRSGSIADIDLATGAVLGRRPVCAAPRGIAFDARTGSLHVACVSGNLVTLPAAGGGATRTLHLPDDLRDVIVDEATGNLHVTRFRRAEVLEVDASGATIRTTTALSTFTGELTPDVAWRAIGRQGGGFVMLHQLASSMEICPQPGGYSGRGSMTGHVVQPAVTMSDPATEGAVTIPYVNELGFFGLTVDVAYNRATNEFAFAAAGAMPGNGLSPIVRTRESVVSRHNALGQAIAVAYDPRGRLIAQTRDPAFVYVDVAGANTPVMLGTAMEHDTGDRVFHATTGGGLACAGCHPEGGDDGHVWNFAELGPRRTQNLRGGLTGTAPFHWDGEFATLEPLFDDIYHGRMGGAPLTPEQVRAAAAWMDTIPTLPHEPALDTAAIARGQAVFMDPNVGCATCHSGPRYTNNNTVDVGTGLSLQVPSLLGVSFRAPFMHTGCAATLSDRFGESCGGGDRHGHTSHLTDAQRADLRTFLETL